MQENNRVEFKRELEELLSKRQQITLQTMNSPRQNLTFKQLRIYYEEKNLEPTELEILKSNPMATIPDLVKATGKSQRTISREIKSYQDAGLIHREGSRKKGRWAVQ